MEYLDHMLSSSDDDETNLSVITIRFSNEYSNDDHRSAIYCFFEGLEDSSFYRGAIDRVYKSYDFYCYYCLGIDPLFTIHKEIEDRSDCLPNFNKHKILFFSDKDYEDYTQKERAMGENIFRTAYYSIENYVYCKEVLDRFLREVFFLDDSKEVNHIIDIYQKTFEQFTKLLIPISALVIHIRKNRIPFSDLDLFEIDEYFSLVINENEQIFIQQKESFKAIKKYKSRFSIFKKEKISLKHNIANVKAIIKKLNQELNNGDSYTNNDENVAEMKFLRGHFLYVFFNMFLNKIKLYIMNREFYQTKLKEIHKNAKMIDKLTKLRKRIYRTNKHFKFLPIINNSLKSIKRVHSLNLEFTINTAFKVDNDKMLFAFLAPRARTPERLENFLKDNKEKRNNATTK